MLLVFLKSLCHPFWRIMILLTGKTLSRFNAIQACLTPRSQRFTPDERQASITLINDLMNDKPAGIHFKIRIFLMAIDVLSVFFGLRTFKNLEAKKQNTIMNFLFDSPVPILRKGFWGLNTLCKLGVYGQESLHEEIGYKLRKKT